MPNEIIPLPLGNNILDSNQGELIELNATSSRIKSDIIGLNSHPIRINVYSQ